MKVLVTGGRSEIGQAIARKRRARGDEVAVTAGTAATLDECRKIYEGSGILAHLFDLENPVAGSENLLAWLASGVDGVVLNAAPATRSLKRLHEFTDAEVRTSVDGLVHGNVWLLRQVLDGMMRRKFGRLVMISSMAVFGSGRYPAYCLGKAGMEGLFMNLAIDYGEFNVTANIMRPGLIATKRTERFWKRGEYAHTIAAMIPMTRLGQPDEVAEAVEPLLAEKCYINGTALNCAGGMPSVRLEALLAAKKS
ncbi:MAG: SDR family oxidoreductase [Bdellovibrionota bacterium]